VLMLGQCFEKFLARSPVSVMVRGILERVFDPEKLEQVFCDHALLQYTRELTFAHCVELMSDVVFRIVPSVGAWYKAHQDEMPVTRQAVYDKLKHLELPTAAGLVEYAGRELRACLQQMPSPPPPVLPGYRVRVLDGNHLAGTEHRMKELRRYRAAALPGHALVFYDPQWEVATDVIPCEDAYAQERTLLPEVVPMVAKQDCIVADRNFCTLGFLFGIARRGAFFVIRHHASNVVGQPQDPRCGVGHDTKRQALYEQTLCLAEPDTGATLVLRRITVQLRTPTRDGDTELHLLTNLPVVDAPAALLSALYASRWTIETAFHHLTVDLACEVDTLGYPKAALFGFCVALVAYNVVALVKGAVRAAHGAAYVEEQLSMYYLTLEVAQVATGMEIALGAEPWEIFRQMSLSEFATTLVAIAQRLNTKKYTKHTRGPKKPPPNKLSGKRQTHVSTARILASRG
jgi:DDE family transposase